MKPLIIMIGLLPALQAPQKAIQIHGRVVAIQSMQFPLNGGFQQRALVQTTSLGNSSESFIEIRFSVPEAEFSGWSKSIQSAESFLVDPSSESISPLNEFIILNEPAPNGENISRQFTAWKAINGFVLNRLPFGKPIKSYDSTKWRRPIV